MPWQDSTCLRGSKNSKTVNSARASSNPHLKKSYSSAYSVLLEWLHFRFFLGGINSLSELLIRKKIGVGPHKKDHG